MRDRNRLRRCTFAALALFCFAILCVQAGCSSLNKLDPADKGNVPAQLAVTVHDATTQPIVQGAAGVATGVTGFPVSGIVTAVGALAAVLASVFGARKLGAAQAHLDTAQEAAGVTSNAAAIAALVGGKRPEVTAVESTIGQVAGGVSQIAPIVGTLIPAARSVATDVGLAAGAVQTALTPAPAAPAPSTEPVVTITSVGPAAAGKPSA